MEGRVAIQYVEEKDAGYVFFSGFELLPTWIDHVMDSSFSVHLCNFIFLAITFRSSVIVGIK